MTRRKVVIRNVVATAELKQKVDATKFVQYPWAMYDPQNYGGRCGYVKDKSIKGRVTVFLSGKMISTGATSLKASFYQLEKTLDLLTKNGFINRIKLKPIIQNIVATLNIGTRIDLNQVARILPKITFEPDQFPGAILRMEEGPVCLLFASGKIVIVGSKSESVLKEAAIRVEKLLIPFKIN